MCKQDEHLTEPEKALIRRAFTNGKGGLDDNGRLVFASAFQNVARDKDGRLKTASDDNDLLVVGILCRRARRCIDKHFTLCWRRWLGRLVKVWYGGATDAEIGRDLGCVSEQVSRWREHGIPIDKLLLALHLTGRSNQPLPRPPAAEVARRILPTGIRQFAGWFGEAGVVTTPPQPQLEFWQFELFKNVFNRTDEWEAAKKMLATRKVSNPVASLYPFAAATIGSAIAGLTADHYADDDLDPVRKLVTDARRAVEECLKWLEDRPTRLAYAWACEAFEDEMLLPIDQDEDSPSTN